MNTVLQGIGKILLPIPAFLWQRRVRHGSQQTGAHLAFMSDDHHRVRDFVVLELPRLQQPISPARIAQALDLPLAQVQVILEDLERHLTFLFRDEAGDVAWAYPVTAVPTPHRVLFSSGEQIYAA